eukprot:XP_024305870.1 sodium/nucleoside cotransporter 1 isoform X12 [Homo sapiens]
MEKPCLYKNTKISQIDATSLIAASVMAAPCALALSKLVYPEVEESKFRREEGVKLTYGDAQNLIEAASTGAAISVKVVANIAANLIAFLAVLDFINAALSWLGDMVDIQGLSFQLICSYILRPVAFLMGVAWEDCPVVAELLGIKLFLNEFVAYQDLSKYKQRRLAGAEEWVGDRKQWISVRAEVLTTFALCGFANFSSIGIMLGGLTSMVPQRKSDFSQIVLRALFTGACVSLVNACMAGILYMPRGAEVDCMSLLNTTLSSSSFEIYQCCREAFQRQCMSQEQVEDEARTQHGGTHFSSTSKKAVTHRSRLPTRWTHEMLLHTLLHVSKFLASNDSMCFSDGP